MQGPLHMPGTAAALVYLALVTVVAALAFELLEMPANKWIRGRVSGWLRERRPLAARAAA